MPMHSRPSARTGSFPSPRASVSASPMTGSSSARTRPTRRHSTSPHRPQPPEEKMRELRKVLLLAAVLCGLAAAGSARAATTLVVWDFKSSEPLMKPYFEFVRKAFEKAHPGVQVRQVAQPEDSYYTVLGTAINGKRGPDVALIHGGGYAMDRAAAFVPLKAQVADVTPDLAGLPNFQRPDGTYIALPITVQGVVFYFSDEVYKAA